MADVRVRFRLNTLGPDGLVVQDPFATNARHRVTIETFKMAVLIELEDALFRTGSSVMLPEHSEPEGRNDPNVRTGAGVTAAALRFAKEHADRKLLVAGHTDTVGAKDFNQALSERRGRCAKCVLVGDKSGFVEICNAQANHKVADYKQILAWVALERGWPCDPGTVNDVHDGKTGAAILGFQKSFNSDGPGTSRVAAVKEDGQLGKETWGAFFECYEDSLATELGVDVTALSSFRDGLQFLIPDIFVGCGENWPLEAENVDEYRSQSNRRVEILYFYPGEEPDMSCHPAGGGSKPDVCELYDKTQFRRRILPTMPSAKEWTAKWDDPLTHMNDTRQAILDAPGLPDGTSMEFEITQDGFDVIGKGTATSQGERAILDWDEWEFVDSFQDGGTLATGASFAKVQFSFVVRGAERETKTVAPVVYDDRVHMQLTIDTGELLPNQPYDLVTPWGTRSGTTDVNGVLDETGLAPGGASVIMRERTLVHLGELDEGWDDD